MAVGFRSLLRRRLASDAAAAFRQWPRGGGLVHETAFVHPSATVEPCAVVMPEAVVGAGAMIGATSVVGSGVSVGDRTWLGPGVRLAHCSVGVDCIIHAGVCVGADGFGFAPGADGTLSKKPQTLRAQIHDRVEIGANSCVDRGSWRDTIVGAGSKLDNMVQIGHNAQLGRDCMLCAHAALAGSSTLGDSVVMGGKSAIKDHVRVASGVRIAAKAGVTSHISEPGDYAGFPAEPVRLWRRRVAAMRRLTDREAVAGSRSPLARGPRGRGGTS